MTPPVAVNDGRIDDLRLTRMKMSLAALAVIATAAGAGCVSGGGGGRIIPPAPEESEFSRLWPNADGNSWTFEYQRHFATESIIPEIAGLADVDAATIDFIDLESRLTGDLPEAGEVDDVGIITLEFRGTIASLDGPKQNLESTFERTLPAFARGGESAEARPTFAAVAASGRPAVSPVMARIYVARPDLRGALVAKGHVPASAAKTLSPQDLPPFTFHDSKFEKQDAWIGTYGDLRADSAFTLLKAPLTEGASFRHQLIPDLADDIWEYGWTLGPRYVSTAAGEFGDAIGVVYFVDYGVSYIIDEQGNEGQAFRTFSISSFYFAPGVGPVYQRTIDFLAPPIPELAIEIGTLFSEASLREFHLQ